MAFWGARKAKVKISARAYENFLSGQVKYGTKSHRHD